MIKNNFDMSTSGVNIQVDCFFDNLQAQTDFDNDYDF